MSILLVASLTLLPSLSEAHVETVQALVNRLTPEMGKPVEVDRTLAGLPVYVDRRTMTAHETLDSVAFGLRASLIKSEKGWRLTRTENDKDERLQAARAAWGDQIGRWIAKTEENEKRAAALGDRRARISHYQNLVREQLSQIQKGSLGAPTVNADANEFTPLGEFYRSLVKGLGVEKLAQTAPEARRVWSNRPLPDQLPYPNGDALLQTYDREQQRYLSQTGGTSPATPIRFTLQQSEGILLRLQIYDEAGKVVTGYSAVIGNLNMAGPIVITYRQMAKPFEREPNAWRALNDSAQVYLRFMNTPGGAATPKEKVPAPIQNPDQVDPLDPLAGPGFAESARHFPGKGVVIAASDELLRVAEECITDGRLNVAGFRHILAEKVGFEKVVRSGVTVIRAQDPFRAEFGTVDRQALGNQARALLKRPSIDMTDVAGAYYRVFPAEQSQVVDRVIGSVVRSQPSYRSTVLNNHGTVLALFGAAFESSGKRTGVTVNAKTDPFRRLINRCVNRHWLRFESDQPMSPAALDAAALVDALDYEGRLVLETSVVPAMAFLGVKPAANSTPDNAFFQDPLKIGAMLGHFASDMALILYPGQKDKLPKQEEVLAKIREFGSYHLASQDRIFLDLYAKNGIRASFSLQQTRPEKTFVKYDDLSPQYQKALLDGAMKAIDELGKGTAASGATGTGDKGEPPPMP